MSAQDGERVLAIDQGTTGTTVLLLDRRGRVRGRGYAELPQHFPRLGWVEHDGNEVWDTCVRAIATALESDRAARVLAIGVTNQRETTLVWDRATSQPIAPAIVWQDRRTAERCDALRRAGQERAIARRTGLRLDPYFSGTKLEWILAHAPGERTGQGVAQQAPDLRSIAREQRRAQAVQVVEHRAPMFGPNEHIATNVPSARVGLYPSGH